jgi:hypothetical protein
VTPVIQWAGAGVPSKWTGSAAEQQVQEQAHALWLRLMTGDAQCAPDDS